MPGLRFTKSSFISFLSALGLKLNHSSHHGVLFLSPPFFTILNCEPLNLNGLPLEFSLSSETENMHISLPRHWGCCYKIFHCDTSFVHENMEDSSPTVCPTCLCCHCKIYTHTCGTLSPKLELALSLRVCTIEPHLLKSRAGLKVLSPFICTAFTRTASTHAQGDQKQIVFLLGSNFLLPDNEGFELEQF